MGMRACDVGREPDSKIIKEMLAECPEKLNFTHFLTLFGEKLHGTVHLLTLRGVRKSVYSILT